MTRLATELDRLHDRILAADGDTRLELQPRLANLLDRMDAAGEFVPADIRDLCEQLTNDAIEAQFDNMPV